MRDEKAQKLDAGVVGKNGKRIRFLSRRKLAVEYAIESVEATRKSKGSPLPAAVAYSLLQKFQASTAQYIRGKRKRPRFKSRSDGISLQAQLQASAPWPLSQDRQGKTFVDLGRIAGETCGEVAVVFHRDVPGGAKIKQVALTIRGERIYAVLMIEAPDAVLEKQFPDAGGRVAGIDPGRKVALSVSTPDGKEKEIIQPSLARNRGFLRKLKRLQRKADRQRRAANPDCYNADGTWIRGERPVNRSRNLEETERQIAEMQQHLADARLDFYHRSANDLLTRYDTVGIGKWRGRRHAPGQGKSKRAQNRKDYDHAISLCVGILRYKAAGAKRIMDVPEPGSTRDCPECKAPTGPTGLAGLKVRQWTCSRCGAVHERDFAAARAIAQRAAVILAKRILRAARIFPLKTERSNHSVDGPKDRTKAAPPDGARVPVDYPN